MAIAIVMESLAEEVTLELTVRPLWISPGSNTV